MTQIGSLKIIRNELLKYNGQNPDYEFIDSLLIDQGAGGGGTSTYADALLNDWTDDFGKTHKGLIDSKHPIYEGYSSRYPNAADKLKLINPKKYRTHMVEEFIELVELGVFRFPHEYSGSGLLQQTKVGKDGEEVMETYELSPNEISALAQIDLMKNEITSIQRFTNQENTRTYYALSKEKENRMHDDRFYVAILLAHRLYELRRGKTVASFEKAQNTFESIQVKRPRLRIRR